MPPVRRHVPAADGSHACAVFDPAICCEDVQMAGRMRWYAAASLAEVVLAGLGRDCERRITKPLLMALLMRGRDRATRRALGLSWVGDVALLGRGQAPFTVGLSAFLGAHVAWIGALRQRPTHHLLRRYPVLAAPYLVAFAGLNAHLWKRTGRDRVPVALYSVVLTAMALTALDSGEPAPAAGGVLFLVSDSLLAMNRFAGLDLPGHEALVMATYAAAQALLAAGGEA